MECRSPSKHLLAPFLMSYGISWDDKIGKMITSVDEMVDNVNGVKDRLESFKRVLKGMSDFTLELSDFDAEIEKEMYKKKQNKQNKNANTPKKPTSNDYFEPEKEKRNLALHIDDRKMNNYFDKAYDDELDEMHTIQFPEIEDEKNELEDSHFMSLDGDNSTLNLKPLKQDDSILSDVSLDIVNENVLKILEYLDSDKKVEDKILKRLEKFEERLEKLSGKK